MAKICFEETLASFPQDVKKGGLVTSRAFALPRCFQWGMMSPKKRGLITIQGPKVTLSS